MAFSRFFDMHLYQSLDRLTVVFIWTLFCGITLQGQDLNAPRFFNVSMQNISVPQQLLTPTAESIPQKDREPAINLSAALRYPISLYGRLVVIGELGYQQQQLIGYYDPADAEEDDLTLRSLSMSFMAWYEKNDVWSSLTRLSVKNSSTDVFSLEGNGLIFSLVHLVQKRIGLSPDDKIGLGTYIAYRDRFSILPVILWQKRISTKWQLDMQLPIKVLAYHQMNPRSRLVLGARGMSANYYLADDQYQNLFDANYRRISANFLVGYEYHLSSLIGIGIEGGLSTPFFSGVFEREQRWKLRHSFDERATPYLRLSIFCAVDKSKH